MKQLIFIFLCLSYAATQLAASTVYEVGIESDRKRFDTVRLGSAGGFHGFTRPSSSCEELYIDFICSNSQPDPNYIPTNSSYTGVGEPPILLGPELKHLFIMGDLSFFNTAVLGNTISGSGNIPTLPPAAYALPTPSAGTTIHFSLTKPPASNPLTWFQSPLPELCTIVIELESADPYIDNLLPLNGGLVIIGAPTKLPLNFFEKIENIPSLLRIQRHPQITVQQSYEKAILELQEPTIFLHGIFGVSLKGPFSSEFRENSSLALPHADAAQAGFSIATNKIVTVYVENQEDLPRINSFASTGGANLLISTKTREEKLPIHTVVPERPPLIIP